MSGEESETAKAEVTKEVPLTQEEKPAEPAAAAEKSPEKVRSLKCISAILNK